MNPEVKDEKGLSDTLADLVRGWSQKGLLIEDERIFRELSSDHLKNSGIQPGERETLLRKALEENEDLKGITGSDEKVRYYSARWMNDAYARILSQKGGDPLPLMAETVRENSEKYPRPVPLDVFRNPPFEMTEEEIQTSLQRIRERDDYKDIATTTTSVGTLFLYSTNSLDPAYASMLAEWLDVGQANNP